MLDKTIHFKAEDTLRTYDDLDLVFALKLLLTQKLTLRRLRPYGFYPNEQLKYRRGERNLKRLRLFKLRRLMQIAGELTPEERQLVQEEKLDDLMPNQETYDWHLEAIDLNRLRQAYVCHQLDNHEWLPEEKNSNGRRQDISNVRHGRKDFDHKTLGQLKLLDDAIDNLSPQLQASIQRIPLKNDPRQRATTSVSKGGHRSSL